MKDPLWLRFMTWGGGIPALLLLCLAVIAINKTLDRVFPSRLQHEHRLDDEQRDPDYGRPAPGRFGG